MNIFARLLFSHMGPLVKLSKKRHIEESDLPSLPSYLHPEHVDVPVHLLNWSSPRKFLFSMIRVLGRFTCRAYFWFFIAGLMSLASPVLVNRFVSLISEGITDANLPWALSYGISLGICGFLAGLTLQYYFYNTLQAYQVSTNILNEHIFRHSLRLTQYARQNNQIGDIVNHMSSDSDSVAEFQSVVGDIGYSVFMAVAVISMLFYYIGVSAIAALAVFFTLAPLTSFVAKRFTSLDTEMLKYRDQRVTLMTQVLNAIRVVKYFAWERSVSKEVLVVRAEELRARKKLARAEVISSLGYLAVSTVVLFVALGVHAWRGQVLDAALIFTCISLFGLLEGPFGDMSRLISRYTGAVVGADRILKFLKEESQEVLPAENTDQKAVGVLLKNISVTYAGSHQEALKNIEVQIPAGGSLAVVGPVGAGKSTLLYAILGETPLSQGRVEFVGASAGTRPRMAYVPQEAYIINDTLLENMQFGEKLTNEDVRRAVHASCLSRDLKEWSGGLRTEIGEKGVNLSGGQKQRVSLARAYLRHPQVVLLDDPLSAVDTETENLLCERLIFGAWKEITRIVVTHRLEHLGSFDQILYVERGMAHGVGTLAHLLKTCEPFAKFYGEHQKVQGDAETAVAAEAGGPAEATSVDLDDKKSRVTEDEDREVGAVKSHVYWDYISSLGGDGIWKKAFILLFLFGGSLSMIALPVLQKAWLSYYTNHTSEWTALQAVAVYGWIGILILVGSMLNHLNWLERGIAAGKSMHDKMLQSVLSAPIRFFDSTPVGRILQRFSRDIESVDVHLQWSFDTAVHCGMQVIVAIFLILGLVPMMIFVIVPVMVLYYIVQRDYRRPAREVKRFDSVGRSPRYAHFKESLQGLSVIRGFDKTSWFMRQFYEKLAHSQKMFYAHYMVNRWFSARIPLIGGLISLSTAVAVTLSAYSGAMTAGVAGLVTLYSLSFWGYLNWGVRIFADIESRMTSIERLKFFAQLPSEVSVLKPEAGVLRETWPEKGRLEVNNLRFVMRVTCR